MKIPLAFITTLLLVVSLTIFLLIKITEILSFPVLFIPQFYIFGLIILTIIIAERGSCIEV